MSLPDARIKQCKKLLTLIHAWRETERQWVQAEMALDNLEEQLKAVTGNCKEFNEICTTALGQDKGLEVTSRLSDKIKVAIAKTEKMQDDILAELESQQKKFYGHRLETEKSLQGKPKYADIVSHLHNRAYKWDEAVRWTVQLHTALCASIEAKKSKLPFDPPAIIEDVLDRMDCLNYMSLCAVMSGKYFALISVRALEIMRVCAKQVLHNHPISGGKVSISIISVDTKTKSKSCTVDMTVDGEYGGSIGGSLIPSSVVTTRIGSKRVMFSWSQPLKSYSGKSVKKVSIDITITDAFTEAIENDLLTLLNVHVPQLKLKFSKNSSKLEIKDKLKRILIDYAAFEGLEQLNDLLKLDFGCSHAHVDSGLSSELPMVPDSHLDSDLEGCPIQQTSSSELPFN